MKRLIIGIFAVLVIAACEPNIENPDDLNSIPEEVGNVSPEV
ncbi:MAG: hypothetical protein V2I76_02840 [Roseobacter sp.]|nr:hypothetical protein [Roseobacter sp.]